MIGKRDFMAKISKAKEGEKIGMYYEETPKETKYQTVHKEKGKFVIETTTIKHE